jgi:uncharacterized protein with FMN-binding domain
MRRVIAALASTAAGLVMLLSFKTHSPPALPTASAATSTTTPGSSSSPSTDSSTSAATTVTGNVSDTRYGPVQVQITVKNGKITNVAAPQYPSSDPRDQQINAYAIPALNQEALQAGNANINMISGATYTSDGYIASLQSALSKAGLA